VPRWPEAPARRDPPFLRRFDLIDPGLVYVPLWRPDSPADVPADPRPFGCLVGVARKP